jgi:hypothetical protein
MSEASGDIGAIDSDAVAGGADVSAVLGSADDPADDEHAARTIRPASSSEVGFQDRKRVSFGG